MEPTDNTPEFNFGIPDEPTVKVYTCAQCGAGPINEPICVGCYNFLIIQLRAEISMGALSDWELINHREMMCLGAASALARECGAYVPYTTVVHLIIARAIRRGDL